MRPAAAVLLVAAALVAAACGYEGTVAPTANGVSGTVKQQTSTLPTLPKGEAGAGKKAFAANGCTSCHTYKPAGSTAKIGPDLDKLPTYAQKAGRGPLRQFVEESIIDPGAYTESGYQNVMPTTYKSLPKQQLADLVAFLTQKR
jgi:cytochrome c551/c552